MRNSDLVIGYLSFITDRNKDLRLDDFKRSLSSLQLLKGYDIISIDNASISPVREILRENDIFTERFLLEKNMYDIALFFLSTSYAIMKDKPYVAFMYDDFIIECNKLDDCIEFLDSNNDVGCIRLPAYKKDDEYYDCDHTPKGQNPDAVRNFNCITSKKLIWDGPHEVNDSIFWKNNWHYTSRPTLWRTDVVSNFFDSDIIPVLQNFELHAGYVFNKINLKVGVLEGGMMSTTDIKKSARYVESTHHNSQKIPKNELINLFEKFTKQ